MQIKINLTLFLKSHFSQMTQQIYLKIFTNYDILERGSESGITIDAQIPKMRVLVGQIVKEKNYTTHAKAKPKGL